LEWEVNLEEAKGVPLFMPTGSFELRLDAFACRPLAVPLELKESEEPRQLSFGVGWDDAAR
jgi:hypothetical protein